MSGALPLVVTAMLDKGPQLTQHTCANTLELHCQQCSPQVLLHSRTEADMALAIQHQHLPLWEVGTSPARQVLYFCLKVCRCNCTGTCKACLCMVYNPT